MTRIRVSRTRTVEPGGVGDPPAPSPADSTFLHIQGSADSPVRMLELPSGPTRVGRSPHCEVRLDGDGLADVQCILRRRGATWHLQPVGPPGPVWVDGRVADHQRPLRIGVPFRVGDQWLTLRPADSAVNDWGSFDSPIVVEGRGAESVVAGPSPGIEPEPGPQASDSTADGRPKSPTGADEERLKRWQARLEQRERWLKDRQDEKRWEAQWRSAGESLRSRSSPSGPPPAPRPQPSPSPSRVVAPPTPAPVTVPTRPAARPSQTPPVARIIEPGPRGPLARAVGSPIRPAPAPTTRKPAEPAHLPPIVATPRVDHVRPSPPRAEPGSNPDPTARFTLPSPRPEVEPPAARLEPTPPEPGPSAPSIETPADGPGTIEADVAGIDDPGIDDFGIDDGPKIVEVAAEAPTAAEPSGIGSIVEEETTAVEVAGTSEAPAIEAPEEGPIGDLPEAFGPEPMAPTADSASLPTPTPTLAPPPSLAAPVDLDPAGKAEISEAGWPSASAILSAQGRRTPIRTASPTADPRVDPAGPLPGPKPAAKARKKPAGPMPSEALAAPAWSLPTWLGALPTAAVAVAVGSLGLFLAQGWMVEGNAANRAFRLAMRPGDDPAPAVDPSDIPRGGWWNSTAPHLDAWAVAVSRTGDGVDRSDEVRSLLDAAKATSRLAARSRFLIELPGPVDPDGSAEFAHLGRPRDVVTLAMSGRKLRRDGKVDASLRAYRSALEMAATAHPGDLEPARFDDDSQVRRYALPREGLLGLVARDMAEAGEWTAEQWEEVLPPSALASLVASKVLARLGKRDEADRLADRAIRQGEGPAPDGFDPAERRAAGAEALASRGRWTDAAEQYRRAIDLAEDDTTRRMWWLNLAEVHQRLFDDAGRAHALEAAKAPDSADDVTKKAIQFQKDMSGGAPAGARR